MPNIKRYINYTWVVFVMVFLVILAGGVVRMTQSGMGCPDWPKCFGRWIPPTDASQLPPDFEKYLDKQDIDHSFNPYHTWIEYINRLLGALLGIFIIIHYIWSFVSIRPKYRRVYWLSFTLLIAVLFQGWLGKKVVDHNLEVFKVTVHMLVALVIAAIPLMIIYYFKKDERVADRKLANIALILLLLLLIQVVLGTQVREQIDEISKELQYEQRALWISRLDNWFFVHRSFSWVLAIMGIITCVKAWAHPSLRKHSIYIGILLLLTIGIGLTLNFLSVPAIAQPLHLLVAALLILTVFTLRLRIK